MDGEHRTMWIYEPRVAEQVFEEMVKENQIPVHPNEWLNRPTGVAKRGARITAITTVSGRTYTGRMFIDATYEADLMAASGVEYRVGREAQSTYGEKWNGVQTGVLHHRHHFGVFKQPISPYVGAAIRIAGCCAVQSGAARSTAADALFRPTATDLPDRSPQPDSVPKPDGSTAPYSSAAGFESGWRGRSRS